MGKNILSSFFLSIALVILFCDNILYAQVVIVDKGELTPSFTCYSEVVRKLATWAWKLGPIEGGFRAYGPPEAPERLSISDISEAFPGLAANAATITDLFNHFLSSMTSNDKYAELPFSFCTCKNVLSEYRFLLILCQLNDLVLQNPDKNQRIVHTAFAEGDLLQTWLLVKGLLSLEFTNIHINLIGLTLFSEEIADKFKNSFDRRECLEVSVYLHAQEYIDAVEEKKAVPSNSFDVVDALEQPLFHGFPEGFKEKYFNSIFFKREWGTGLEEMRFYVSRKSGEGRMYVPQDLTRSEYVKVRSELKTFLETEGNLIRTNVQEWFDSIGSRAMSDPLYRSLIWRIDEAWRKRCDRSLSLVEDDVDLSSCPPFSIELRFSPFLDFETLVEQTKDLRSVPLIYGLNGNRLVKHEGSTYFPWDDIPSNEPRCIEDCADSAAPAAAPPPPPPPAAAAPPPAPAAAAAMPAAI